MTDVTANAPKEQSSTKIEASSTENETCLENNSVQCRLLNEENIHEEEQPNYRMENRNAELKENGKISFFRKVATNLDLDLLRDNRYIMIVLGRL